MLFCYRKDDALAQCLEIFMDFWQVFLQIFLHVLCFNFFFCIMYYTKCIKHRNKIKVRRTCCFIWLSLVILNFFVWFVFQHHHDHLIHCSGARAHAAVSVDVQSRVDQHTPGEPSALRRDHSHPLQHPHSHRVRGLAKIPLYSSGWNHHQGDLMQKTWSVV